MSKLALLLYAALLLAEAPKPLTADQRAEALVAALNTSNARLSLQRLDLEYRQLRDQLEDGLKKAESAESQLVTKLKKESGAEACSLTSKAEWECKPKEPTSKAAPTK